jgi:AcrR family transcriptional regulator
VAGLTREQYFEAALGLLGEQGPEALTLAAVCERLGVTKGSFYHHFDTMAALHQGMLDHWVEAGAHVPAVADGVGSVDPRTRLTALRRMAVEANHEIEVAIRGWAAWYEPAAEAHRRVADRRHRRLVQTFEDLGIDEIHAVTLARVGTALMVGVQSDVDKIDRTVLDEVLTEYQRWIEASLPPAPPV